MNIIGYLAPVLAVFAGFGASRISLYRSVRYQAYLALLFVAFLFDLMSLSFGLDVFDFILKIIVLFSLSEFFWAATRLKQRKLSAAILLAGAVLFCSTQWGWFGAGPGLSAQNWSPRIVSSYLHPKARYAVKERFEYIQRKRARKFTLSRSAGGAFLEKTIRTYDVPADYSRTEFSFAWQKRPLGVRLDIIADGYVLWTLGEEY